MSKLNKGDTFPNYDVVEAFKGKTTIADIMNHTPTMFVVLRYIGCTVCRYDVHLLIQRINEFKEKGVNVCVVMQSSSENVKKDIHDQPLPFSLICDTDMHIYNSLDIIPASSMEDLVGDMSILEEKAAKAKACGFEHGLYEGNEQQLPAFFYVDGNGKVIVAHYGTTITDMPTIDEMLEMVL